MLTTPELRDVQHREETFLRASGQCLSRLHEMVREADYCAAMSTDAQGVTIDYRVDRDRRHDFKRAGLYLGFMLVGERRRHLRRRIVCPDA